MFLSPQRRHKVVFQCSSASRKFLNQRRSDAVIVAAGCFSALQRAENSSIKVDIVEIFQLLGFSALQRAENSSMQRGVALALPQSRFSALQRAENSSIPTLAPASIHISDRDDHASSFLSLPGASP